MLAKTMTTKQQHWLDHVKLADNSDGTIADYALANGVRLKTLYQWKSKLLKLGHYQPKQIVTDSHFVEVKSIPEAVQQSGCRINLPNGVRIEFSGELDNKAIRSIITSAGSQF